MRIGLDILSEIAGRSTGTETYAQGFLNALGRVCNGEHQFFCFVNSANEELYRIQDKAFHQVRFPFSSKTRPLRVLSQLTLIPYHARRLHLDVVNFFGTTGAFGVGCAKVQHVQTLHHLLVPGATDPKSALFKKALMGPSARSSDVVIANSQSTGDDLVRLLRVPLGRVVVVPEAVDHELFFPRAPGDGYQRTLNKYGVKEPYVLFVSALWPYKNAHGLIEAYAILASRGFRSHRLVIVGGFPMREHQEELVNTVRRHRLEEFVYFVGHTSDRREVRDFYVGADVFVYPTYSETFGLPLLEAMACGTPIVASDRGSVPEVSGGAALLTDPDDYEAMAQAIRSLIEDENVRGACIAKGLTRAGEFSWERTARETIRAYELALSLHRSRAS